MPQSHAVVTLSATSGIPEDAVVNTWSFDHVSLTSAVAGNIVAGLVGFYNTDVGTNPVSFYLANSLSRTFDAARVDVYDITSELGGQPHGVPTYSDTFDLGSTTSTTDLPREVAMVLTLTGSGRNLVSPDVPDDGDPGGVNDPDAARDRPMQRRTGRVYLGPLNAEALDSSTGRPKTLFMSDILASYAAHYAFWIGAGIAPSVWSRKNAEVYNIKGAFTDNAFDTQRRRGLAATVRSTIAL